MVSSGKICSSLQVDYRKRRGYCAMEVTVLLLLYISLTAAMSLKHAHRLHTDTLSLKQRIQRSEFVASVDQLEEMPSTATYSKILHRSPHQSLMHAQTILKQSATSLAKLRKRRAPMKGCQFGTCQMHNLANTLYRMGQTSGKEQSKRAGDPNGYGR